MQIVKEVQSQAVDAYGPRIHVSGSSIIGWWDQAALKRAAENLVMNAAKYGAPDTPITVKVTDFHERMVLSVHNEGPPIPPDEQECIFQMFRRAKSVQQGPKRGWGIGLPYVRAVAESHGGSIELDSTLEQGTTFLIDIPLDGRPYQHKASPSLEK